MPLKEILIVDDSEAEQFLYGHMFKKYDPNIKVSSAYDGQEALEKLTEQSLKPDCILLDINMPRMNGFEFLEAYTKTFKDRAGVVVMLTSSVHPEDKGRVFGL